MARGADDGGAGAGRGRRHRFPGRLLRGDVAHLHLGHGCTDRGDGAGHDSGGYATAVDELEPGLSAVAAPVFGPDRDAVAALSVSGPTMRMSSARLEELGALLVHHAAELSALLDHDHHEAKRGAA